MAEETDKIKDYSFLMECRQGYFDGITPAMPQAKANPGYQRIIAAANWYFKQSREEDFYLYVQEGQYLIALWVAHMLLEYGKPTPTLREKALGIIKRYSYSYTSPGYTLNLVIAQQEDWWLDNYLK
jgi:hypothetical protein